MIDLYTALGNNPLLNQALSTTGLYANGVTPSFGNTLKVASVGKDYNARNDGQFGFAFRYIAEALNSTEFGLYMVNYHAKEPTISADLGGYQGIDMAALTNLLSGVAGSQAGQLANGLATADVLGNIQAHRRYAEDIRMYGFSFNTTVGQASVFGEVAYRPNLPIGVAATNDLIGDLANGAAAAAGGQTINIGGQMVVNPGKLVIGAGAAVNMSADLLVKEGASMIAHGSVNSSGQAVFSGTVAISSTATVNARAVAFGAGSSSNIQGKVTSTQPINVAGTIAISPAAQLDASALNMLGNSKLTGGANLPNTGVVTVGQVVISPGNSPGTMTMKSLDLGAGTTLEIEVRNATGDSGIDYDLINVIETLALDFDPENPVMIDLISLDQNDDAGIATYFDEHDDYAWTIASAGSITGFDPAGFSIDVSGFLNDVAGSFSVFQNANDLQLVYTAAPLPGDFDDDGDVDGSDLSAWSTSFGPGDGADADNDGDSDGADFLAWQRNLGSGVASVTTALPEAGAVPEPSTLALIALAAISAGLRRPQFRVLTIA